MTGRKFGLGLFASDVHFVMPFDWTEGGDLRL